jgi:serine/threonine protein kinase/Tol biopolymer transport system component
MTLPAGSRLGPYEVLAPLGAGGMGEVYRARDSRLNRDVAIKVLPAAFTEDRERLARFEREAQLLAQLHHPSIAAVFGLEESGGARALVMELVEGEDLAARIARGPIPLDEAVPIATGIAEALEAAHDQGIIHRDLKPANIKVGPDGSVKVLDFGLAKAMDPARGPGAVDIAHSPTLTAHATQMGVILGTAAYMSPEQARGRAVDKRADIWAFGAVLYEMLTGRRAFAPPKPSPTSSGRPSAGPHGDESDAITDVIAAVLRQDIDWTHLPASTPPRVRRLLERCLTRDPLQRLRDIGEARVALTAGDPERDESAPQVASRPSQRVWLTVALACLLLGVALGALLATTWRTAPPMTSDRPRRAMVVPTPPRSLDDHQAISPDGTWLAYTAGGSLWIRNLAEIEPREVLGAKGARRPFWSPASDALAYAAEGTLFKVTTSGMTPVKLCEITGGDFTGGSWSASEGIVFTASRANWTGDVLRVSPEGGNPEVFTKADATKGERRLADPHFLPDGRSLLYTVVTVGSNEGEVAIDRGGVRTLLGLGDGAVEPAWSPTGHVVFQRNKGIETSLWALPWSLETMKRTGELFRLAIGGAGASIAGDTLTYSLQQPSSQALVRVDRAGRPLGVIAESRSIVSEPRIAPDGSLISATVDFRRIAVWDVERGVDTPVTADDEAALHATWLPRRPLELSYTRMGQAAGIWTRRPDGTGSATQLFDRLAVGTDFSRDGRRAAFYVVDPETGRDLWARDLDPPGEAFVVLRTRANEARPRISPDGRFIAYQSDASGRWEISVMPFPRGEGRLQVSAGGGQHAVWNPTGGELFYVSGDEVMAVDVTLAPVLKAGKPRRLFGGSDVPTRLTRPRYLESFFDVAPDGRSFIVVRGHRLGKSDVVVSDGIALSRRSRGAGPSTPEMMQ